MATHLLLLLLLMLIIVESESTLENRSAPSSSSLGRHNQDSVLSDSATGDGRSGRRRRRIPEGLAEGFEKLRRLDPLLGLGLPSGFPDLDFFGVIFALDSPPLFLFRFSR
ncbi:hypothetical protein U1Q18_010148 [Sarracenia purpurea var. burkii]